MKRQFEVGQLLPTNAVLQLQRAASTPLEKKDPLARAKAIDQAVERIKRDYPEYFKTPEKEQNHDC